jgi:hypothetical protein
MSSDKLESLSEVWSARFDDRDDEELACTVWARSLAKRDHAMAHPFLDFVMPDEAGPDADKGKSAAVDAKPR